MILTVVARRNVAPRAFFSMLSNAAKFSPPAGRGIAQADRGRIDFSSEPGRTEFFSELPPA